MSGSYPIQDFKQMIKPQNI